MNERTESGFSLALNYRPMAIRLKCGDGGEVTIPRTCFEKMTLFQNPDIAKARTYVLRCKASTAAVNLLLGRVYGESEEVKITETNFKELQKLSEELGFSGLDEELKAFESAGSSLAMKSKIATCEERINDCDTQIAGIEGELELLRRRLEILDSLERRLTNFETIMKTKEKRESEIQDRVKNHEDHFKDIEHQLSQIKNDLKQVESPPKPTSEKEEPPPPPPQGLTEDVRKEPADAKHCCCDVHLLKEHEKKIRTLAEHTGCVFWTETKHSYQETKPLSGIISYLTNEFGGNVHHKGIVNVTASSVHGREHENQPYSVTELDSESEFFSNDEKDSWVCYDFRERRVKPRSYTVRSMFNMFRGKHYPKSWVFEGSNDGTTWTELNRQWNNSDLKGSYATHNFKVSVSPNESFRFLRLRQTGKNHADCYFMIFSGLEIFGVLLTKEKTSVRPPSKEIEFVYEPKRFPPPLVIPEFDGIVAHLGRECCGNVHDKGVVIVTSSTINSNNPTYHPKNATEFGTKSCYFSENKRNSWICYDFKVPRVIPKSYSMKTCADQRVYQPKSWALEVSNDGKSWTEVDRKDCNEFLGTCMVRNFEISRAPSDPVRFIRLKQTGKCHDGEHYLVLHGLEIFGTLFQL